MSDEKFMRLAIAEAQKSETPFGAVIVNDHEVVVQCGNTVHSDHDPTCHAEVNAIRQLTKRMENASPPGTYTLYTTCEPCPMCAATCLWAGIHHIIYGVGNDDFENSNPNMIDLRCEEVFRRSPAEYKIESGLLKEKCKQLHKEFPLDEL